MIRELVLLGHDANRIREEVKYLIRRGCILTEHQHPELRSDADLLKLSPAGFVHLQAVSDVNYLAACAEDTWTNSKRFAETVARRIGSFGPQAHYSTITATANARDVVQYLCSLASREVATPVSYMESSLEGVEDSMEQIARDAYYKIKCELGRDGWERCEERFHKGMECAGTVAGVQNFGVFVKLDGGPTGLIHWKSLPPHRSVTSFSKGERVVVRIERVQVQGRRIGLIFVSPSEKEASGSDRLQNPP
jgi:S1 RNA binding family protein